MLIITAGVCVPRGSGEAHGAGAGAVWKQISCDNKIQCHNIAVFILNTHTCTDTHAQTDMHTRTHTCTHMRTQTCMHTCTYMHIHTCAHTHACTQAHTCTHTHTHTHARVLVVVFC